MNILSLLLFDDLGIIPGGVQLAFGGGDCDCGDCDCDCGTDCSSNDCDCGYDCTDCGSDSVC